MRDWEEYVRSRLDLPAMTDRRDQRVVAELAAHAEEIFREAREQGAGEEEAEARALAALGATGDAAAELLGAERRHAAAETGRRIERIEEGLRGRGRRWVPLADVLRDFRLTLRALARQPAFTAVVVLVLALGIGATTAIFTLLDSVVLSPLPFARSDRLVSLGHVSSSAGGGDVGQCAAWHLTYQEENRVFDAIGMYGPSGDATVIRDGEPEAVRVLGVTSGVFTALGVPAAAGRVVTPADEDPDAPPVVLLEHGYWRSRYGGDPSVVGRSLQLDGVDREVIGVLPPELRVLDSQFSIAVPMRFRRAGLFIGNVGYGSVALLRDGVTESEATADVARMLPLAFDKFPGGPVIEATRQANYVPNVRPLKAVIVGNASEWLWVLMAGVTLILLIACANVANLLLVRADARDKEMALRAAIGAGRGRIVWEHLRESLLLGAMGGLAGLGLAYAGLRALVAFAPRRLPRLETVSIDLEVLVFAAAVSLAAALLFGAFPAVRSWRSDLAGSLKQGGHAGAYGRRRHLTQNALAVSQVALALVLLVSSGLVLRSALELARVDPGFAAADDVLALRVTVTGRHVGSVAEGAQLQEAIARRLAEIPGVRSVGMGTALPMHVGGNINPLFVEGVTVQGESPPLTRRHRWVGGGYFEALGIPLLAGRVLTWDDARQRAPYAVVSRTLAVSYWGSVERAIGGRVAIRPDPPRWYEVVGVVADVREDGLSADPAPMVYWPQVTLATWQGNAADEEMLWGATSYAVRSARVGTPGLLEDVTRAVRSVNPTIPLQSVGRLSGFVSQTTARFTFTLALLAVGGVVALLLGLVGVYGVVSYGVSRRTVELGMRMALGAEAAQVTWMVLRRAMVLAVAGVAVGLLLSLCVTRLMSGILYGVHPTDPATFLLVAAALTAAALLASWLPARRASRVDPMVVLRAE